MEKSPGLPRFQGERLASFSAESADRVVSARWVFPGDRAPVPNGSVVIRGGRIAAVGTRNEFPSSEHYDDAVITPGWCNPHLHLDLSGARGLIPPERDGTAWLSRIVDFRRCLSPSDRDAAVSFGIAECMRHGVTTIGDVTVDGGSWTALQSAPLTSVVFEELIGLAPARAESTWARACRWTQSHPETDHCRHGLSPHAPYSAHGALIRAAGAVGKPVCMHLAEWESERELLAHRRGPLREFLERLGAWDPSGPAVSWEWILWRLTAAPRLLLAHANYLDPATDVPPETTIVYCPRTHHAFGHPPHRYADWRRRGVRVVLGTDSLASNPDLDPLAEARFVAARDPGIDGAALLRMITVDAVDALSLADRTGSLTAGKFADLCITTVGSDQPADPHDLLFRAVLPDVPRRSYGRGTLRSSV